MTPTESIIAETYVRYVPGRAAALDDDMFTLGGDSLSAVRIILDLERRFGLTIPQETLLDHRSVGAMAAWIDARLAEARQ